jgi:hypothetical protein
MSCDCQNWGPIAWVNARACENTCSGHASGLNRLRETRLALVAAILQRGGGAARPDTRVDLLTLRSRARAHFIWRILVGEVQRKAVTRTGSTGMRG